ncbi:MAG: DEAD/DEAH box helicase family protein [Clostridia bacterium]|nr:DEAD/DEAH box helicase family protein [Clostridia bacterium]
MLSYEELLNKYNTILKENEELKNQVNELKAKLGMPVETEKKVVVELSGTGINKYSSATEKILLYRSLFCGREDVFARRWYSKTTEKSGYQPVCENEWADGLCDKRKYKCSVCPNRKLSPITDEDIYKHLEGKDYYGRDVIGIYPMLIDETCHFLCADFDDREYEKDVLAFCEICDELNISAHIERSRSGGGAHVWIFFDTPVLAATARKLGSLILTKAMEKRSELSFSSYDRLFPNQDTMPSGGFGNLISLPLQGQARKNDNSVFVDRKFKAYSDQWEYLSKIQKLSMQSIEKTLDSYSKNDVLGILVDESPEKPWETKSKIQLTSNEFSDKLEIVRSNMIYIPRKGLSANAQNQIKRLAAFKNPDFYRSQAMRLSIYDKPRIICTADITDAYIGLPRGCESALLDRLADKVKNIDIIDKTNAGENIPVEFNGKLREEQELAANELLKHNIGVLSATTAFGKTVIASYIASKRKTNTLILVHTQALMQQWKKSLEQFLTFDITPPEQRKGRGRKKAWSPVGLLGAGKNTLNGIVDVAVMQSLVDGDEVKDLVRNYGMIIVDECHHVSAVNFEKILKYANAKYVHGLTATPTRQDGHHPIIFMQCGPIRYRVDAKAEADKRNFEHCLIPRFTSFRNISDDNITALYKKLSDDAMRNNLIVNDVALAIKNARTPIILTERREHVTMLAELLKTQCDNVIEIVGTTSTKSRRETLERLKNIPQGESLVVVATGRYVGEGFDYPRLDTLFLALPIAWKGKVAQYAGRLHRNYPGKVEVQVYDYIDIHVPVLERMYQKRVKSYSAIGYKTKITISSNASPDLIYDGKTFYSVFCRDIEITQNEILIVSPFMRKARLTQMMKMLSPLIMNKVAVTVVTRPPDDFKDKNKQIVMDCTEQLKQYGIKVIFKSDFHQKFTIIDQYVVWYGSVNFLSFGTHEESIMRFENSDVAHQLMDTIL